MNENVFLEARGNRLGDVLLRLHCRGGNLWLKSLWLQGTNGRELNCIGLGVLSGDTLKLQYSSTLNGVAFQESVMVDLGMLVAGGSSYRAKSGNDHHRRPRSHAT